MCEISAHKVQTDMKKIIFILLFACSFTAANAQGITNNGARIVSTSGSYWVIDNDDFTLTSESATNLTQFHHLVVKADASVTLSNATCLTISGNTNIENGGLLTLESGSSSTASLIVGGTASGTIHAKRYITGNVWHLISSPVGGQDINNFVVTNTANAIATNDPKYGLAPYNNSTPGWNHFTTAAGSNNVASAGNFTAGKGYEVLRTNDGTLSFTGTVATSDVTIGITAPTSGNPWNLVGNPYPSAICANTAASDATSASENLLLKNIAELDDSYLAMYVWDANAGAFLTVNQASGATYFAPGQAFFVYSITGGGTFSFTEAMQTSQTVNIFKKSTNTAAPAIILSAEHSEGKSKTNIKYFKNTTTGLDPGYDAGRFSAGDNSFAVYTHLVDNIESKVDFDIQCLPANEFEHIVPVGLNAPENTEVIFRAVTENLPADVSVYLEDKITGSLTDLHEAGSFYAVTLTEQIEGIGRFYMHTATTATGTSALDKKAAFTILPIPQNNSIRIIGHADNDTQVAIYDVSGRLLNTSRLINAETNDVNMTGHKSGFYIVTIKSSTQQTSEKIMWVK